VITLVVFDLVSALHRWLSPLYILKRASPAAVTGPLSSPFFSTTLDAYTVLYSFFSCNHDHFSFFASEAAKCAPMLLRVPTLF
jgi:hypothetical protein